MFTTAPKMTLWLATALISITRQSKATTAPARTGAPVFKVDHRPTAKRSALAAPVRPANTSARASQSAPKVLTQKTLFSRRIGPPSLLRLRHTSRVGGASDTEHTAVAVNPVLPPGPAVVTTWTAAPRRHMASRNTGAATVTTGSGPIASKAPAIASSGR